MRKFTLVIFMFLSSLAWASEGTVMITTLEGEVLLAAPGQPNQPASAFLRLKTGDQLQLGSNGRLTLIYAQQGRQERWQGQGRIEVGGNESRILNGTPALSTRQIPTQIALQMNRTPTLDASGKVGMVRVRAIPGPDALAKLERQYQEQRNQADAEDRGPEIFLLAGLFEIREYEQLKEKIQAFKTRYPTDPEIKLLSQLYAKAMRSQQEAR